MKKVFSFFQWAQKRREGKGKVKYIILLEVDILFYCDIYIILLC